MSHIIYTHRGKRYGVPFSLIEAQGIRFEQLCKIIELQKEREDLFEIMRRGGITLAKIAAKQVTQIEYELQNLWGFSLDFGYHKHWNHPGCKCPQMDNRDMYPYGAIISGGCELHNYLLEK